MAGGPPGEAPMEDALVALVHDLRTPLAIVSGFAELLVNHHDSLSTERRLDYARRIGAAAQNMLERLEAERARQRGP
jgi:K+-sensing histidine kinase KdpD